MCSNHVNRECSCLKGNLGLTLQTSKGRGLRIDKRLLKGQLRPTREDLNLRTTASKYRIRKSVTRHNARGHFLQAM